jgi:hypothetical protein
MYLPFEKLVCDLDLEIGALSSRQVEAHPDTDRASWTVRQIVEHLMLTYRLSGRNFRERLAKGQPTRYRPSAAQSSAKFVVMQLKYFPKGRTAPPAVMPTVAPEAEMDGKTLTAAFSRELAAVDGLLHECRDCFGRRRFATHQILGPLNAMEWRKFHVLHARHHFKQIRALVREGAVTRS